MDDTLALDAENIEDLLFSTHPYSPLHAPTPSFGSEDGGETQEFSLESMLDYDFDLD